MKIIVRSFQQRGEAESLVSRAAAFASARSGCLSWWTKKTSHKFYDDFFKRSRSFVVSRATGGSSIFKTKHGILLTFVFKLAYGHCNILIFCLKFVLETRGYKNLFPEGVSTNFRNWGYIWNSDSKLYRFVQGILSSTPINF